MTYDAFLKEVEQRAGLERITPGEFHDILVQLPSGYVELLVPEVARR